MWGCVCVSISTVKLCMPCTATHMALYLTATTSAGASASYGSSTASVEVAGLPRPAMADVVWVFPHHDAPVVLQRYFDAARSYGKAEDFLSSWLAARGHAKAPAGPDSVVVGSK